MLVQLHSVIAFNNEHWHSVFYFTGCFPVIVWKPSELCTNILILLLLGKWEECTFLAPETGRATWCALANDIWAEVLCVMSRWNSLKPVHHLRCLPPAAAAPACVPGGGSSVSLGPVWGQCGGVHRAGPGQTCHMNEKEAFLAVDHSDLELFAAAL